MSLTNAELLAAYDAYCQAGSIATTERYTLVSDADRREAVGFL